jgi:hypothetical protein
MNVSIRKLRVTLEKTHSLKVSKYKLWKTLHELGFKYAKISGNKKALVERKNLVNKRIIILRTIKQKRNEGYSIVYLDETWVDTQHTASHQWTPPNPSDTLLKNGFSLLIKSLSKLSKESLHLFTDFSLSSTGSSFNILFRNERLMSRASTVLSMTFFHA